MIRSFVINILNLERIKQKNKLNNITYKNSIKHIRNNIMIKTKSKYVHITEININKK